ncbi:Uncharacterized protein BC141101_01392 [Bacillus toyonensis]|uniref:hypothetical protein n=1 Tax=Bacillus TaxID=1386 RepID=UPI0001A0C836|nr:MULTISPECIES: hypothetical protein [Bacillus]EEL40744.1 hypothetical protein bcere0020_18780 [Bacillus cereus Rock3-29]KAB0448937.1 hypothetical protein CH334_11150 [Lysinibacillus sp. VIA-II-2016]EJQ82377.1 hypothetical protein IGK_01273 [Bacillus toyonensis]EJV46194.1 hypothetical protein IEA_03429 [Bacillus toyonensis]EJV93701.1 hypothetical protein IGI_03419 [Bacillus toyonensis]
MWNIKEEDLNEFKNTCKNRLSPDWATGVMFGTMFFISLIMFFLIGGLIRFGWSYYPTLFDKIIVSLELVFYSLQVIFLIIYLFPKMPFKLQKLQTLVVLLYAFQLGTITFTMLIIPGMSNYSIDQITLMYVGLLFLGAVILHILATIDTFRQASKGAFNKGEESSSFFSKTKRTAIKCAVIYVLILLILIYVHNDYTLNILGLYAGGTLIMYAVAIGAAEFQLLAYCRFKFPSFYISWEEHERERQKRLKLYEEKEKKQAKEIK